MSGRKFRENAPKRRVFSCRGYPRPTHFRKSAHSALRADTGGIPLATLCHESFDALLLSRNVHSLKLLLIKLLDD